MLVNLSPGFQMVSKMVSGYKKVRISKDFNGYWIQVLPVNYQTLCFRLQFKVLQVEPDSVEQRDQHHGQGVSGPGTQHVP